MGGFEHIAIYIIVAVGVVGAFLFASAALGPNHPSKEKLDTYECGVPLIESSRKRYDVKYYLVAVLFLLFDLETVLIYPLALRFRDLAHQGWLAFFEIFIFVAVLVVGLVYAVKKGALEWD